PILSSPLAQEILSEGYTPRTLDRVYASRPSAEMGLVGRVADRMVLDLPVHLALRERLEAAVGEICAAAVLAARAGEPQFRVLSAPCGLAAELCGVAKRLRDERPETFSRLRCWGVDRDPDGALLPEAARRARQAGLNARFIREDLRRYREVAAVVRENGPFHLVSCVGLARGRSLEEIAELVRFYAGVLAPGGTLLVDRWESDSKDAFRIDMGRHGAAQFQAMLRNAGLTIEREHTTGEGGCVLLVARKTVQ
ncbi:MAG TPA: class I SAM-dependent methyltransferase, partial [Armatimonadota bacterium]|nr:class I SAM-dependent methyltransferase [Armatimonadota bacterium]